MADASGAAVGDTGIGVTGERARNLCRARRRAEASTTLNHGGSGLGLAVSRCLRRMPGGDVRVVSRPGEGPTFTVPLPAGEGAVPGGTHPSGWITDRARRVGGDRQEGGSRTSMRVPPSADGPMVSSP
jgi:hypothetical protein